MNIHEQPTIRHLVERIFLLHRESDRASVQGNLDTALTRIRQANSLMSDLETGYGVTLELSSWFDLVYVWRQASIEGIFSLPQWRWKE